MSLKKHFGCCCDIVCWCQCGLLLSLPQAMELGVGCAWAARFGKCGQQAASNTCLTSWCMAGVVHFSWIWPQCCAHRRGNVQCWQCSRNSQCGFCVMYFLFCKPPLQKYPILNHMYIFLLISFIQGKVLTFGNGTLVLSCSKLVSMYVCTNKYVMITLIMSLLQQKKTKQHFLITFWAQDIHTHCSRWYACYQVTCW